MLTLTLSKKDSNVNSQAELNASKESGGSKRIIQSLYNNTVMMGGWSNLS